jgi:hypothetical protein
LVLNAKNNNLAQNQIFYSLSSVYDSILDKSTALFFTATFESKSEIANNENWALMIMKVSRKSNG